MTYHAGIGPGMIALGCEPGPPQIICDNCGATLVFQTKRGLPPVWFLTSNCPPGWLEVKAVEGTLRHYCPTCVTHSRGARR